MSFGLVLPRIVKTHASYNVPMFSFIKKKLGWGSAQPESAPSQPSCDADKAVGTPVSA